MNDIALIECDLDDHFFDPYPQEDDDLDRIPDGRDNACGVPNHEQVDADHDGVGAVHPANACIYVDAAPDTPGDGRIDEGLNCMPPPPPPPPPPPF